MTSQNSFDTHLLCPALTSNIYPMVAASRLETSWTEQPSYH